VAGMPVQASVMVARKGGDNQDGPKGAGETTTTTTTTKTEGPRRCRGLPLSILDDSRYQASESLIRRVLQRYLIFVLDLAPWRPSSKPSK
jgi:hypothetical protein